jgi:hypothetical protein
MALHSLPQEQSPGQAVEAPGAHHGDRAGAALDQRLEQGRLADPAFPVHDHGAALTAYERGDESVKPGPFGHPADDHRDAPEKGREQAALARRHERRVI